MYVDNNELYQDIVEWKARLAADPTTRMPDKIGKAIMLIANGLTGHWRFNRYTEDWKEKMVGDAVETCVKNLKSFDTVQYKNPHAYITMICARCFINRKNIEKKAHAAKMKYFIEHVFDFEDEELSGMVDFDFYSDMVNKVNEFEASNEKKPKKEIESIPDALSWLEAYNEADDTN